MNHSIIKQAAEFISEHRRHNLWLKVVTIFSGIIIFITTYMLIFPAIAVEREANCGLEEHTHNRSCYEEVTFLSCGLKEDDSHTHGTYCYSTETNFICTISEHVHTDLCFEKEKDLNEDNDILSTDSLVPTYTDDVDIKSENNTDNTDNITDDNRISLKREDSAAVENENVNNSDSKDVVPSGSAVSVKSVADNNIADDIASGGAVEFTTNETNSEQIVEDYSETTTLDILFHIEDYDMSDFTFCGIPEHKHTDNCYNENNELICGLEEHIHDKNCHEYRLLGFAEPIALIGNSGIVRSVNADGSYTITFTGTEIPENFITSDEIAPYRSNISRVVITGNVETIGDNAFESCQSLVAVEIEENNKITNIGKSAFKDCTNLLSINLENLNALECIGSEDGREGEVFRNTGLTSITIPSSVNRIYANSFRACQSLVNVEFEENKNLTYIGSGSFMECYSLEKVTLENIKTKDGCEFNNTYNDGVFRKCYSLKSVIVPSSAKGNLSYLFCECSALNTITFEENKLAESIAHIIDETSVDILDLRPLRNLGTKNGDYTYLYAKDIAIKANVSKIILPKHITNFANITANELNGAFKECKNLNSFEFEEGSNLYSFNGEEFLNDISLADIDLSRLENLKTIGLRTFAGCVALEKMEIPPSVINIYSEAFKDCYGLNEFVYRAKSLSSYTGAGSNIFANTSGLRVTIGKEVDDIPDGFLRQLQEHYSAIVFEPDNDFVISEYNNSYTSLKAPFDAVRNAQRKYHSDSQGNLYRLNADNTAELVYVNKDALSIEIPALIKDTQGNKYTVASVGNDTFKDSNITAVSFEDIQNIKFIDSYGFANAEKLASINGITTLTEVEKLFKSNNIKLGNNAFYNTALGKNLVERAFEGDATADTDGSIIVDASSSSTLKGLSLVLNKSNQIPEGDENEGKYYTGNNASISVGVSNMNDDAVYRVYIKVDDNCEINISNIKDYNFELCPTEDPYVFYYELKANDPGATITPQITLGYPNYTPPGSKAQIWGVKVNKDSIESTKGKVIEPGSEENGTTASDEYFDLEWVTKPKSFNIQKSSIETDSLGFISSGTESTLSGLKYGISYTTEDEYLVNQGSDIVKYVEFGDTLTLPEGLHWRNGISVRNTRAVFTGGNGTLYVNIDNKEYALCYLSNFNAPITAMWLEDAGEGNYRLCWRVVNTSSESEIAVTNENTSLSFGNEIIVAANLSENYVFNDIVNHIETDTYYTYSEMKEDSDSAVTKLNGGSGKIIFYKEKLNNPHYMNEEIQYKLTVENPTAFSYSDISHITDWCSDGQYITGANMQKLFDDCRNDEELTIEIRNAVITTPFTGEATAVDGKQTVELSAENTGVSTVYDGLAKETINDEVSATIRISNKNGAIIISVAYASDSGRVSKTLTMGTDFSDIQSALDSLAYIVTQKDSYVLTWDYVGSDFAINGGEKREYLLNTTAKTSLMNLDSGDYQYFYGFPANKTIDVNNAAEWADKSNRSHNYQTTERSVLSKDLEIYKSAFVNGEELDENFKIEDNTIIDYNLRLVHHGSGSYDTLPVIDHMSGKQVVIAEVSENKNTSWANHAAKYTDPLSGIDYYVLNEEYTYEGVYLNGFYADRVIVNKNEQYGFDTVIKYYFKDTIGREFVNNIGYRALSSQEFAGNDNTKEGYRIANEVWVNDYPTHRIWDTIIGGGSILTFDKKIVLELDEKNHEHDLLDPDDALAISRNANSVMYRLELKNDYAVPTYVTGKDMYDMLPLTGTAFDWVKNENISLSYAKGKGNIVFSDKNGEIETPDGEEWHIVGADKKPTGIEVDSDQQFIVWNDDFRIDIGGQSKIYIYVTLRFTDTDEQWQTYINEYGTHQLINTFYVYEMPDSVRHTLSDPGKVLLQKGVYEIGHYIGKLNGGNADYNAYFRDSDRYHYANNYNEGLGKRIKNVVTYYVIIRNSGTTNLYLSPIYDILPEGFEYMALRCQAGNPGESWYHVGNNNSLGSRDNAPTHYDGATAHNGALIAAPSEYKGTTGYWEEDYEYSPGRVYYDSSKLIDGRERVKFRLEGVADNNGAYERKSIQYDEKVDAYYLLPGHFTQFAYTVYTGDADITEAVNTVAMEYFDPYNADSAVNADTDTKVSVTNYNNKLPNDGSREVWDSEKAKSAGFECEKNENSQWLASDVTITRGTVVPGITKTVENSMVEAGGTVNWTVKSHSNGTAPIVDYTIEDEVEKPFKFTGDVTYATYNAENYLFGNNSPKNGQFEADTWQNNSGAHNHKLLSFLDRTEEDIANNRVRVLNNYDKQKDVIINGSPVELDVGVLDIPGYSNGGTARVSIEIRTNEKGNEVLRLHFSDPIWSIPAGGYSELKISTKGTEDMECTLYPNTARLMPADKDYDSALVTQGKNIIENGINIGVENRTYANVYRGFPSAAVKKIEEKGNPANNGISSDFNNNYILLDDGSKLFTYTLCVTNSNAETMDRLVIIDNLPKVGDSSTIREDMTRESEFGVRFANDPAVEAYIVKDGIETLLSKDAYRIEYSNRQDASEFSAADWEGTNSNGWTSAPTSDSRSLRMVINDKNKAQKTIEPNSQIQLKFDAIIDSGNTDPAQIAWNSFAYQYEVGGLVMTAAPLNVGIKIPGAPYIQKSVVNANGKKSAISEEQNFEFIIYEENSGLEAPDFGDYSKAAVIKALNDSGVTFTYIDDVTVEANSAVSDKRSLDDINIYSIADGKFVSTDTPWVWSTNKQYHAVEINTYEDLYYRSTNGINNQQNYTFKYEYDTNVELAFENEKQPWNIRIFKYDDNENYLAGALFGIYSPNIADMMPPDEMQKLGIDSKLYGTVIAEHKTYYLASVGVTPESGIITWSDLTEDTYVVFEITPPDGYYADEDNLYHLFKREDAERLSNRTLSESIINYAGTSSLPTTGGSGFTAAIELFGLLIMCVAVLLFGVKYIKKYS